MTAQGTNGRIVELFRNELVLCEVGPGQTVAVLSEGDQLRGYAEASLAAARDLGADAVDVNIPSEHTADSSERMINIGKNPLSQHPQAMQACKDADIVVDHMLLLFSKEQIEMQKAGTRIILIVEPLEVLERLFPSEEMRVRVEAGPDGMGAGEVGAALGVPGYSTSCRKPPPRTWGSVRVSAGL